MRNYLRYPLLLLLVSTLFICCKNAGNGAAPSYVCPANRFITEQFTYVTSTVLYGQAIDYTGKTQSLQMDLNQPAADTLAHRPLIIYCHGGGFTTGTRNGAFANKFCQAFAKRGYVTASIDYRLGIGNNGDNDVISAQIRAVQDAKAAVRFFKQTAIEQGNPYRIDTAQIYIAGESSGAIVALQMGYLNTTAEFAETADALILSNLNGIEGTTTLPYSSKIAGVISLSGAMLDVNWLNNGSMPVIMVHSTNDAVMPYKSAIAGPYTETRVYGSFSIDSAAAGTKVASALHTFYNAGNAPYLNSSKYADTTIKYVAQQLFGLIDCQRLGHR
ncbi:alpha/beta hydrolase family protein [Mucilaginibacter gracilis]|uniref:Alpha/beta hydrolase family protein n=1 Tax=Mucilaginibacter gracilis TaxID=423350 RepID=A0A495J3P4_9SPHI|nr:alpha/beta hydrolase [Mucilaginibacter gracilis]RKR83596.1 alpha/beta hydrolase family protein [Mucilaginibacter gracilis]